MSDGDRGDRDLDQEQLSVAGVDAGRSTSRRSARRAPSRWPPGRRGCRRPRRRTGRAPQRPRCRGPRGRAGSAPVRPARRARRCPPPGAARPADDEQGLGGRRAGVPVKAGAPTATGPPPGRRIRAVGRAVRRRAGRRPARDRRTTAAGTTYSVSGSEDQVGLGERARAAAELVERRERQTDQPGHHRHGRCGPSRARPVAAGRAPGARRAGGTARRTPTRPTARKRPM